MKLGSQRKGHKGSVGAFNQEKALVGAFSVIVKTDESFAALHTTQARADLEVEHGGYGGEEGGGGVGLQRGQQPGVEHVERRQGGQGPGGRGGRQQQPRPRPAAAQYRRPQHLRHREVLHRDQLRPEVRFNVFNGTSFN